MSIGTAIGIGGFSNAKDDAKVTEAGTSSVTLAGSFNGWSATANPLTLNGDYWTIDRDFSLNETFKVVVNGSDWVSANWEGIHLISGIVDDNTNDHNFKISTAGRYRIKAVSNIGDYGNKGYGVSFEKLYSVTQYEKLDSASATTIKTDYVVSGATYGVPANRFKSGYTFDGWYTSATGSTKYTSRTITANTSIYARYTSGTWSGTINVDLRDSSWSEADAKYAVMFMDKTTYPEEHDDWSSIVSASAGQKLVQIPYNIGFSPLQMLIVRYNPAKTDYDTDKWSYKWGQTYDDIFGIYARIGAFNEGDNKNVVYVGAPKIIGGNGSWGDIKYFDNVKLNGYNNAEYYTTVTLAANVEFKVQVAPYADGDYYANYTTHSSISSNFSGGGNSNIRVVTAGTYAIYFDYFGTYDNSARIYITTEAAAAADEWSQYFLNNVGCDPTGVNPPSGWSACATEYAKLSGDAKHIVYSATADEGGSYVEKAVARYDQALRSHPSLTKFIVDSDGTTQRTPHVAFNPIAIVSSKNTNGTIIIVVISVITVGAVAGYFFLRRRKED